MDSKSSKARAVTARSPEALDLYNQIIETKRKSRIMMHSDELQRRTRFFPALTLFMVIVTFASGALIGLPLGYVLWRCASLGRACEPILGLLFASPLILLYPICWAS